LLKSQSMGCCPWIDTMSLLASGIPDRQLVIIRTKQLVHTIRFDSSMSILFPSTTNGKFSGSCGEA
jgi:hypothetical protein